MPETYSQEAFGQPTFTDAHARASFSGFDRFDIVDATNFYHEHEYHPGQHLHALHIPSREDVYPQRQHFAYDSNGVSPPGKRTPLIAFISTISYVDTKFWVFLVPLILSLPCSWTQRPSFWVAGFG
jgi:hypothetical protein